MEVGHRRYRAHERFCEGTTNTQMLKVVSGLDNILKVLANMLIGGSGFKAQVDVQLA